MIYVLIFMALVASFVAVVWAIGVGSTVHDHEEVCRAFYEWEEPLDENSATSGDGPISFKITHIDQNEH